MNDEDQDRLQVMLQALQTLVVAHVTGIDAPAAEQWMEDALDEAYSASPRPSML